MVSACCFCTLQCTVTELVSTIKTLIIGFQKKTIISEMQKKTLHATKVPILKEVTSEKCNSVELNTFSTYLSSLWAWLLLYSAIMPKSEDKYVVKVFNWSEVHLSEMTCYKIHTLDKCSKTTSTREYMLKLVQSRVHSNYFMKTGCSAKNVPISEFKTT